MIVHHIMSADTEQSTFNLHCLSVAFAALVLGPSLQGDQVSCPFVSCGAPERHGLPAKVQARELLHGIVKLS